MRPALVALLVLMASSGGAGEPPALGRDRLAWGTTQLRAMLKDRPAMTAYVAPEDDLWRWAVRQFAGELVEERIAWDAAAVVPAWESASYSPQGGQPGSIRVSPVFVRGPHLGAEKKGCVLWINAAFELVNARNYKRKERVSERARCGLISRDAYVLGLTLIEAESMRTFRAFYDDLWVPHCRRLALPPDDATWFNGRLPLTGEPEEVVAQALGKDDEHAAYLGKVYDEAIKPTINKGGFLGGAVFLEDEGAAPVNGVSAEIVTQVPTTDGPARGGYSTVVGIADDSRAGEVREVQLGYGGTLLGGEPRYYLLVLGGAKNRRIALATTPGGEPETAGAPGACHRYELDLADGHPTVRIDGRRYFAAASEEEPVLVFSSGRPLMVHTVTRAGARLRTVFEAGRYLRDGAWHAVDLEHTKTMAGPGVTITRNDAGYRIEGVPSGCSP